LETLHKPRNKQKNCTYEAEHGAAIVRDALALSSRVRCLVISALFRSEGNGGTGESIGYDRVSEVEELGREKGR
jgi:pimeloyl-CoA synthetase